MCIQWNTCNFSFCPHQNNNSNRFRTCWLLHWEGPHTHEKHVKCVLSKYLGNLLRFIHIVIVCPCKTMLLFARHVWRYSSVFFNPTCLVCVPGGGEMVLQFSLVLAMTLLNDRLVYFSAVFRYWWRSSVTHTDTRVRDWKLRERKTRSESRWNWSSCSVTLTFRLFFENRKQYWLQTWNCKNSHLNMPNLYARQKWKSKVLVFWGLLSCVALWVQFLVSCLSRDDEPSSSSQK